MANKKCGNFSFALQGILHCRRGKINDFCPAEGREGPKIANTTESYKLYARKTRKKQKNC